MRTLRLLVSLAGKPARFGCACLALASLAVLPDSALADGMRCGTKLVSDGDTLYDVQRRCGDPKFMTRKIEQRTIRRWVSGVCAPGVAQAQCGQIVERTVEVQIDEWTYDFGPTQFVRYVIFEDGRLLRVISGSYGEV